MPEAPSAARLAWTAAALGRAAAELRWRALPAREGPTALWEVEAASGGGAAWILKEHRRGRGLAQEIEAYRRWAAAGLGRWLAEVVAVQEAEAGGASGGALLLRRLPGRAVAGDGEVDDHRRAGELLAALQAVAIADDDPLTPAAALGQRIDALVRRGRGRLPAAALAALEARHAALAGAGLGRRALAHRDFGPWNWIRDRGRLWVVDLEHARPDLPLVDLARLASGPWRRRSALADGFFAGFGRALDAEERALLELLGLLHALTTLSWAAEGRAAHLAADAAAVVEGFA